ncbi:hypothetical protein Sjap_026006 [Stephania japonica]|uniref:Uncharacterized protein n=1 Tax=Stephania japonica TaxID=461633 RepID=A0AAP0E5A7_9MAGN
MREIAKSSFAKKSFDECLTCRNHRLYKVSLSVIVVFWGLVLLLSIWISQGNSYGGKKNSSC